MTRALGLDPGRSESACGSAIAPAIASPLQVLQRSGSVRRDHQVIADLVIEGGGRRRGRRTAFEHGATGPAQAAIDEAAALATVVGVPVVTFDERRTTVTADQAMMQANMRAQARRRIVDKIAAAVMLQNWLDSGGTQSESPQ